MIWDEFFEKVIEMKKLTIVTYANFPNGEAASVRIYAMCRMLLQTGHDVSIICMNRQSANEWREYNGVKYYSIRSPKNDLLSRLKNVLLFKRRTAHVLKNMKEIDILMPLSIPIPALLYCERFAKKRGIGLITDRTEWYSPCEFKMGRFSFPYISNTLTNRCIIDRSWKVVSISRLFEEYYRGKGISTIRIPAVMVKDEVEHKKYQVNSPLRVVYAGSPAKKDSLDKIVDAFDAFESCYIKLLVYGVTLEQFNQANKRSKRTYNNVEFKGRVSREEVLDALSTADFTTIFRDPRERFTKAGFPSKVAESMICGVPVISNYTSDLELYLEDLSNSVIVDDYSIEAYIEALNRIAKMDPNTIELMHEKAYLTATECFNYSVYSEAISSFIDE